VQCERQRLYEAQAVGLDVQREVTVLEHLEHGIDLAPLRCLLGPWQGAEGHATKAPAC
jgi:hypothetical protein